MSLHDRLVTFIKELNLELNGELKDDTSLIKSGLFDSLALFNLAVWVEQEINLNLDLTAFDLVKEWDTIADVLNFIERHHYRVHRAWRFKNPRALYQFLFRSAKRVCRQGMWP